MCEAWCVHTHLKIGSPHWMLKKDLCVSQKALYVSKKLHHLSKKLHHLFKKARHVFKVGVDYTPSQSCSFLLLRSSLHFKFNALTNSWLKMTGHPLILPSAMLSKSLHNLPSAISFLTNERRLKGWWRGVHSLPVPLSTDEWGVEECLRTGKRRSRAQSCLDAYHWKCSWCNGRTSRLLMNYIQL